MPDRAAGRGRKLMPSPVKERALELGLPVLQPEQLRTEARAEVTALKPELLACVAYGKLFGPKFLELFAAGTLNLHPSLLPKYRGPAPIPAPILNGDRVTGVTIMALAREMDAGDIYAQREVGLDGTETSASLSERLAADGAALLVEMVDAVAAGTARAKPQDESKATYTSLIEKSAGLIDWSLPAREIERRIRAYQPWPLAHTTWNNQRLNLLGARVVDAGDISAAPGTVLRVDTAGGILVETGNGLLALTELQLQSRKALSWDSFLNGVRDFIGAVLGG
jgi:methionyl-tRNA formyltransferase